MKLKFRNCFVSVLLTVATVFVAAAACLIAATEAAAFADAGTITRTTATGNYLNDDYVSVYKIPTSMITPTANGGAASDHPLSYAFDGNWNTFWQTAKENAGQNDSNPAFLNAITVEFSKAVTIDRIMYASSSERDGGGHGFPSSLNIYTANGGELSLFGQYVRKSVTDATNDRVVYTLSEAVTVTQIKFEFRQVNQAHNWTATAKEICFLQPDNANANKVLDLFDDYAQYSVKSEYRTKLSEIRSGVTNLVSYESALKPLLDRADSLVSGALQKDSRREFSTDPNAENVIQRYGNLSAYARNTLKLWKFGIDHQVLGIAGRRWQQIIVYVEADEGDPLPTIVFTQVKADIYQGWKSEVTLKRGKNILTVANLVSDRFTQPVVFGGPIHLINPYTPSQQSSNVKIYVEGGYLYPVFHKGDDEAAFRKELTDYHNEWTEHQTEMNDVAELVGDHFIHTVSSENAYTQYVTNKYSPQKNATDWDKYIRGFLEFGGISFDPQNEHYDEKNLHLYTNFRMAQPLPGVMAFAGHDHIGYCINGGLNDSGLIKYGSLGWGVAHEIGHALDLPDRMISETTNNMWSKYAITVFENDLSHNDGDFISGLTPDATATGKYFSTHRSSYQIWWNIEACHKGFWGNLENMYRYFDEAAAKKEAGVDAGSLTQTERLVYYSSLAAGEDLGYYYERVGFTFEYYTKANNDPDYDRIAAAAFKVETASEAYKKLINKALQDGKIEYKGYKYWYVPANQYTLDTTNSGCYDSSTNVEIKDVWKTSSGYTLLLTEAADSAKHLGYEIMEYSGGSWNVIGFTYSGSSYNDNTKYLDGYVPQYKVRAYDRAMGSSAVSEAVAYEPIVQTGVCRIGETYYDSIKAAVAAASANATIYVCSDLRDGGIVINKNLTLRADPSCTVDVVITRYATGAMFTLNDGITFTIGNSEDTVKIVLDGYGLSQNGELIRVGYAASRLFVYNAELRNNRNTEQGGAIYNKGTSVFTNVVIKNNYTAKSGGAIANVEGGVITFTECMITANTANWNGGAFTIDGRTSLIRTEITGNTSKEKGGALYIIGSNDGRYVTIDGGKISGNTAELNGSAICLNTGKLEFVSGSAELSGEFYKNSGTTLNINATLPDFTQVAFSVPAADAGKALLTANGDFTFTEADLTNIKVNSLSPTLGDDAKNILIPKVSVTLSVNGTDVVKEVIPGDYVLPQPEGDAPEGKEFSHWDIGGVEYKTGDTVNLTEDTTVTAVYKDIPSGGESGGDGNNPDDTENNGNGNTNTGSDNTNNGNTDADNGNDNTNNGSTDNGNDNTDNGDTASDDGGMNGGIVALIVIIAVVVAAGAVVAVIIVLKKKK